MKKGALSYTVKDKYEQYKSEDGHSTIESIRTGTLKGSCKYSGLLQNEFTLLYNKLSLVSNVRIYDPRFNDYREFEALVTDIKFAKLFNYNGYSAWSLSFKVEEL